jgi:hypothetical protein
MDISQGVYDAPSYHLVDDAPTKVEGGGLFLQVRAMEQMCSGTIQSFREVLITWRGVPLFLGINFNVPSDDEFIGHNGVVLHPQTYLDIRQHRKRRAFC